MSIKEYKESIIKLVDAENDEGLLSHWKEKMEWEASHRNEIDLDEEEMKLVEEGMDDYKNGRTISLDQFMNHLK